MTQLNDLSNLKQHIGFFGLLAMSVGLNIGGALFALTTLAAGMSGPSLPLAMLISSIPCLLAVVPYCLLSSALPATAATYRYIQLINPAVSLISMLTLLVCILIGAQPLFALAFGMYLKELIGVNPLFSGLIALTFFYGVNMLGVKLTAKLQIVLLVLLMAALLLFVATGLPEVQAVRFSEPFPNGLGGLFTAAGLLFTFCAGGFFIIDMGGEVIQAQRIFPKVLLLGLVIVVVLNILIMVVVVGIADVASLKGKSLIQVASLFMSRPSVAFFTACGALVACATTINVVFSTVARGMMVVSLDGFLPEFLSRVSQRFGSPHLGLTVSYVVSSAALLSIPSLLFLGSMLNLGLIVAITLVAVSGLFFAKRYPSLYARSTLKWPSWFIRTACILVIGINLFIFLFFVVAIGSASFAFLGIGLCATLYTFYRKKTLASFDITAAFPELKTDISKMKYETGFR